MHSPACADDTGNTRLLLSSNDNEFGFDGRFQGQNPDSASRARLSTTSRCPPCWSQSRRSTPPTGRVSTRGNDVTVLHPPSAPPTSWPGWVLRDRQIYPYAGAAGPQDSPRAGAGRFRSAPSPIGVSLRPAIPRGLLPSRARLRFTGHQQLYPIWSKPQMRLLTDSVSALVAFAATWVSSLLCTPGDISILPRHCV
jgi:hypothetical protein